MKGRKNGPSSCEMDSSEVFELGNDSLYKFHRPLLISLSLYEESRIRKYRHKMEGLNSDSSGL